MKTRLKSRFIIEKELSIEKGCRCLSCWEYTGKILLIDNLGLEEDIVFDSEEDLVLFLSQTNEYYMINMDVDY